MSKQQKGQKSERVCDICGKNYVIHKVAAKWKLGLKKTIEEHLPICDCIKIKQEEDSKIEILNEAGIPHAFLKTTLKTFPGNKKYIKKLQEYIDRPYPRIMFMAGHVGTGKTGLACSAAKELLKRGKIKYYLAYKLLAKKLAAGFEGQEKLINELNSYQTLIIDEIGLYSNTKSSKEFLEALIVDRHDFCKNTILITNLAVEDDAETGEPGFRTIVGERVYDRIKQNSKHGYIDFTEENLREKYGDTIYGVDTPVKGGNKKKGEKKSVPVP